MFENYPTGKGKTSMKYRNNVKRVKKTSMKYRNNENELKIKT